MSFLYRPRRWINRGEIIGIFNAAARRIGPADTPDRGRKPVVDGDYRHQAGAKLLTAGNRWLESTYSCATLTARYEGQPLDQFKVVKK